MCSCPDEFTEKEFLMDSGNRLTKNPYGVSASGVENGHNDNLFFSPARDIRYPLPIDEIEKESGIPDLIFAATVISDLLILIFAWILMFCFYRKEFAGTTE